MLKPEMIETNEQMNLNRHSFTALSANDKRLVQLSYLRRCCRVSCAVTPQEEMTHMVALV